MKINSLLYIVSFFVIGLVNANPYYWSDSHKIIYSKIFSLDLQGIESSLTVLKSKYPSESNAITNLIEHDYYLAKVLLSESEEDYKEFLEVSDQNLKNIQKFTSSSDYYLYLQSEIKSHIGFIHVKLGHEYKAALEFRSAFKMLEENETKFPASVVTKKWLGVYRIIIGSVPQKYHWILNFIGFKGSLEEGIKNLKQVVSTTSIFQKEARLLEALLSAYVLNKEVDKKDIMKLAQDYPDQLVSLSCVLLSLKSKSITMADKFANTHYQNEVKIPYVYYLKAEIHLFKAEYKEAIKDYNYFLAITNGKNYIKDSYYKLFLSYWFLNDPEKGKEYLSKIPKSGALVVEPDKNAHKAAQNNNFPRKELVKARLLFDSGLSKEAILLLTSLPDQELTLLEYKEKQYRLGRCYHDLKKYSLAITSYTNALEGENPTDVPYWIPNASLQLGYLYLNTIKDTVKAKYYFNNVFSFKNYDYQNSIEQKANIALKSLM